MQKNFSDNRSSTNHPLNDASASLQDGMKTSAELHKILKTYWGYDKFRPLQEDIMQSVLQQKDTLALMPTGGGKSLCYQVPAMLMDGVCLVVSPLIALMKDQVEGLRKKNITAFSIYSGMSRKEVLNTLQVVGSSNCKFLYVSPERLETRLFKEWLPSLGICLLAVDEAHCISQWGYDFRPSYLRIAALREELPGVPVLALTASATPEVQKDICVRLQADLTAISTKHSWNIFRQGFERPNLSYSSIESAARIPKITDILQKIPGTAIVYCKSRRRTKEISDLLNLHGISSDYYHAGLNQMERNAKQEAWIQNKIRVIVCTNAFGMGIDKPDVRTVMHADVPDCLENYYQEAGRAGRDGKKSYAILLYQPAELEALKEQIEIRFPSLDQIKKVYQAVYNYLQVPAGAGTGEYFVFDMTRFLQNFKLDARQCLYAIQALEQDGWLTFNEQNFKPSALGFVCDKAALYRFEEDYPHFEPLIKALLRSYEGIFDQSTPISESNLAYLLREKEEKIKQNLLQLHKAGLVEYEPKNEDPQIYLHRSRVPVQELHFNMETYLQRKEKFRDRVHSMINYVLNDNTCRSQITASYFGDDNTKPCGICDNCLRKKNKTFEEKDFSAIRNKLITALSSQSLTTGHLLAACKEYPPEQIWKVINFLVGEEKIYINEKGFVALK